MIIAAAISIIFIPKVVIACTEVISIITYVVIWCILTINTAIARTSKDMGLARLDLGAL